MSPSRGILPSRFTLPAHPDNGLGYRDDSYLVAGNEDEIVTREPSAGSANFPDGGSRTPVLAASKFHVLAGAGWHGLASRVARVPPPGSVEPSTLPLGTITGN